MDTAIPIIDLFAGPGGLGEGFSALGRKSGKACFKIGLSVEKDPHAHSTLELRSFVRQFPYDNISEDYYAFLRDEITRDQLFERNSVEAAAAREEAWHATLGTGEKFDDDLDHRIEKVLKGNDRWVLIGGPPCQAYSVIGRARRSRDAENLDYLPENDERNYLYIEYLRIIARHKPAVFVMENVKGLLSSTVQGERVVDYIFADLRKPSTVFPDYGNAEYQIFSIVKNSDPDSSGKYQLKPKDFIVECEKYGIPQARHRVILLGIRKDFKGLSPEILETTNEIPAGAVLDGLPVLRSGLSKEADSPESWKQRLEEALERRWLSGARRRHGQELEDILSEVLGGIALPSDDRGGKYIRCNAQVRDDLKWWYHDPLLEGITNHASRGHMIKDIHRYMFAACFSRIKGRSPKLQDFPADLQPDHVNAGSGHFDDRFRVQIAEKPSTTITSHISKDGHYYIHPDPYQCRSLTVREAARLQTFPDNYYFCGNRTQQYAQVGNAVPPLLAFKIAKIVKNIIDKMDHG